MDYKDTDLSQIFFASELVVLGTVIAIRPVDRNVGSPDNPMIIVETAFDVDIAETFRTTGLTANSSKTVSVIVHHIGDRDRGDHIERYVSSSVNPLSVGQSYLLFLRPRRGDSGWSLTSESGRAVMHLQGSVVAPQDSSPLALRIAGQPWSALREELHRLGSESSRAEVVGSQGRGSERRGATQPLSPVSVVSWFTENGSQGARLDVAIIWRGGTEWFFGQPQSSSGGGSADSYSGRTSYGDIEVAFTVFDNPRRLEALGTTTPLNDHNVVMIDDVGTSTEPRIVKTLRIDPAFSEDRNIEGVLRTSAEVVAFIGCDVKASSPGRQAMFDRICSRLR